MKKCETCVKQKYGYLCDGCIHDPSAEDKYDPMTNADRIRAMSDEELARKMYACNSMEEKIPFCQNLAECDSLLETEEGIPEDKCIGCLLKWLKQPAQEEL